MCAAEVHVVMEHAGEVPILYVRCDCGNRAKVWAGQDI